MYRLARHKTAHHGHQRTVALGPKAQELLRPFLAGRDPTTYLFSPQEAVEHRLRLIRTRRQTKVQPSQVCRKKARPKHRPGERYNSRSYLWAIRRVIGRLNEAARLKDPSLPADHVSVPLWHPHQLRHTYASEVRRQFGLEAAQVALGHAKVNVTELYAERDLQLAARVARAVG